MWYASCMIPTGLVLLNDKYLEIARMLLKGHSQVAIAEAMGMSPHSISTIINKNTLFKRAMSELQYLATQEAFDLILLDIRIDNYLRLKYLISSDEYQLNETYGLIMCGI